jgi:general secretion pathway protein D
MSSPMARGNRLAALLVLTVVLTGCATTGALRAGQNAEFLQEYDRAILEYTKALREHPDNRDALQGLQRTKLRASLDHFARGRRLSQAGRLEEAAAEVQIAAELNPDNADIESFLAALRLQLRTKVAVSRDGKTELQSLVERMRITPPPGLELPPVQMPASLSWNGSARELFLYLGKLGDVSVAFDTLYRDQPITIDLRNQSLEDALNAVTASTRTFYRVTSQRTVTVIPDTPAKRQEYDEEYVQLFPLSNADLKEASDVLRIVADNRRLQFYTPNNMIAIKDSPERLRVAQKIIAALDRAKPEVVVDIEILEVDRTRLREYGLQIASPGEPATGLNGSIAIPRDDLTLDNIGSLSRTDVAISPLPGLFYRLIKQDSNTRTLANTQLRMTDGTQSQARFGEEVPVPVTQFSPIATGGLPQQPTVSYNYKTVGVTIEVTPRAHHDGFVTLALELEVSSVGGTGFGGLPTFGTRTITTTNRLRDGETNMLAGLIRDDERRVRDGIPGLVDIPGIGHLFAYNRRQTQETDVVITLTPHIIRVLDVAEADLRAFQVDSSTDSPGFDLTIPIPGALPPPDPAQQQPPINPGQPVPVQPQPGAQQPPGQIPPAQPIFPPQPPPQSAPPPGR